MADSTADLRSIFHPAIVEQLKAFARDGKTGKVTLNFVEGRVLSCDANEHITLRSNGGIS